MTTGQAKRTRHLVAVWNPALAENALDASVQMLLEAARDFREGGHTLGVRYVASTRDAKYGKFPDWRSTEGAVTIAYSFLGANQFEAVKW